MKTVEADRRIAAEKVVFASDFLTSSNLSGGCPVKTLELGNAVMLEARGAELKKILFATDFSSYSKAALPFAVAVAMRYDAELYAAHVVSTDAYMFATPETWPAVAEYQEEQQHIAAARLEASLRGTPHKVVSAVGDIADVILQLVRDHEIDLLVLGTHGRSGLPKLVLGSVAEKIFRQASCPVLTVGPQVRNEKKDTIEFTRIVFATDFSEQSLAALSYAFLFAKEHRSRLSLLHVVESPDGATVEFESNGDFVIRRMRELIPRESDLGLWTDYAVEFGHPGEQIVKFAHAHGADLIVLGIHAPQGPLTTLTHLAHSQTQDTVAHATCPVLTVRG